MEKFRSQLFWCEYYRYVAKTWWLFLRLESDTMFPSHRVLPLYLFFKTWWRWTFLLWGAKSAAKYPQDTSPTAVAFLLMNHLMNGISPDIWREAGSECVELRDISFYTWCLKASFANDWYWAHIMTRVFMTIKTTHGRKPSNMWIHSCLSSATKTRKIIFMRFPVNIYPALQVSYKHPFLVPSRELPLRALEEFLTRYRVVPSRYSETIIHHTTRASNTCHT